MTFSSGGVWWLSPQWVMTPARRPFWASLSVSVQVNWRESPTRFSTSIFFIIQTCLGTDQWVNIYCRFWLRGIIQPWGVKQNLILEFVYNNAKCSPLLVHIIWFNIYFCDTVPLKACANILRIGCWLPGFMSDSPGSHSPGRLTQRSMIPSRDWLSAVQYDTGGNFFMKNLINSINPLVSGPDSNEEKKLAVSNVGGMSR